MRITPDKVEEYLQTKDVMYRLGWECCSLGEDAMTVRRRIKEEYQEEFDYGYGDCYANGESDPGPSEDMG